jgi:hypothetical protein
LFINSFLGFDAFDNQQQIDEYIKWCFIWKIVCIYICVYI